MWGGDGQLVPIPPQLRRLLAILVAAEGASVSADRIAEHVTGGRFDSSAAKDLVLLLEHPIAFTEFADLDRAAAFFARESLPK